MLKANKSTLITPEGTVLLKDINFDIGSGELAFLFGPNGIGKTSLVKAMLKIGGLKIDPFTNSFKSYTYVPQIENKDFLLPITISDISSEGPLLTKDERKTKWNRASGGQRKKALIEKALRGEHDLYILDEPYNHLDAGTIGKVNQGLEHLLGKGKTILMIGHKYPQVDEKFVHQLDVSAWK